MRLLEIKNPGGSIHSALGAVCLAVFDNGKAYRVYEETFLFKIMTNSLLAERYVDLEQGGYTRGGIYNELLLDEEFTEEELFTVK